MELYKLKEEAKKYFQLHLHDRILSEKEWIKNEAVGIGALELAEPERVTVASSGSKDSKERIFKLNLEPFTEQEIKDIEAILNGELYTEKDMDGFRLYIIGLLRFDTMLPFRPDDLLEEYLKRIKGYYETPPKA